MDGAANNRSRLIFAGVIIVGLMVALVIALVGGEEEDKGGLPEGCAEVETPAAKEIALDAPPEKAPAEGATATVSTSCGDFTIQLATKEAPITTGSFAYQAEQGVYDDTAWTRIAPDFVIQGGDPTGTQAGDAGYTVTEAPPSDLQYTEGVVAMAKSGSEPPGTSGSQFFVVIGPGQSSLPPDYALVGNVTEGMDIVQRIAEIGTATGADGPPAEPVLIESVAIDPPTGA